MLPPRGQFILLVDIVETIIPNRFEPPPLPLAAIFVWSIICEAFSPTIFACSHLSVASTSWASTSGMGVARACLLSACKSARRTRGFCGNLCEIADTLLHLPLMQALYPILQHLINWIPPPGIFVICHFTAFYALSFIKTYYILFSPLKFFWGRAYQNAFFSIRILIPMSRAQGKKTNLVLGLIPSPPTPRYNT